jgi:hypothetical protein
LPTEIDHFIEDRDCTPRRQAEREHRQPIDQADLNHSLGCRQTVESQLVVEPEGEHCYTADDGQQRCEEPNDHHLAWRPDP